LQNCPMLITNEQLKHLILKNGLIDEEGYSEIEQETKNSDYTIAETLVEKDIISDENLGLMISDFLKYPFIILAKTTIPPDVFNIIPEKLARRRKVIPFAKDAKGIKLAMVDPSNKELTQMVSKKIGLPVTAYLATEQDISNALRIYRKDLQKTFDQLIASSEIPMSRIVDLLINYASQDKASDIHIEPQENRLRIRFRIDGILRDVLSLPSGAHTPLISRIKVLAEMNIAEQRRPQDGQFSITVAGRDIDIRTASMSTVYGERVTLRILDKALSLFALPQLGLATDSLKKFQMMMKSPFGLVLVGGPTGSGKTTTLYALINSLDRTENNIMTVEDPVEYHFANINQTRVNPKAGITFANGLRAIMRHDPDVVLVGEIRDNETATIAIQAALTGHLVLSSVHANDAVGVLFRMVDLGIERYMLASTLVGISTQRMVRKLCPHCLAPYQPSPEELAAYDEELSERPITFYGSGLGCNLCGNIGYQGRTGIFETLLMSETIRRMLLTNTSAVDIKAQALQEGMVTMKQDGMLKVKQGITTVSEVLRNVFSIG